MLRMQLNYPINKTNFGKLTPPANAPYFNKGSNEWSDWLSTLKCVKKLETN